MLDSLVMRRFLGRLRRVFPLRGGALVLLGTALALVLAFSPDESDFLLYPAGLVALALIIGCLTVVIGGTLRLRSLIKRMPGTVPEQLETQHASDTGFRVPGLRGWLILDVSVEWIEPHAVTVTLEPNGSDFAEVITSQERGRHEQVVRRFTVADVFGLASVSFDVAWTIGVRFVPSSAKQPAEMSAGRSQGETMASPAGRTEGDLVEMRQYAHGDSMRHVLWKAYARSRKLLVRMPERALAPGPTSVAFFVAGPEDEASASAARLYLEAGLLGSDLLFAADGSAAPARSAREAVDQLVESHAHRAEGGLALEHAATQIDPSRLTSCLIFVPSVDGPWRGRVTEFVRRHHVETSVIIGVDGSGETPAPSGRVASWLFEAKPTMEGERPGLVALRQALEAEGLQVRVLHRGTGQVL